jgi:hypothetical protein
VVEEFLRLAGILTSDQVGLFEHANRSESDVLQVADGGRHQVKSGRQGAVRAITRVLGLHDGESNIGLQCPPSTLQAGQNLSAGRPRDPRFIDVTGYKP